MAKSPEQMLETMVRNLEEKTGRSLDEWVRLESAAEVDDELLAWLREAYDRA